MKTKLFLAAAFAALALGGCSGKQQLQLDPGSSSSDSAIVSADEPFTFLDDPSDISDDKVENTTFTRTVTVSYYGASATVDGTSDDFEVTVQGARVTIVNKGQDVVRYQLGGTSSDGCFKLHSSRKQALVLDGLHLTNPTGAALNVQGPVDTPSKGKRTFIVLEGDNRIGDGPVDESGDYPDQAGSSTEDMKGAFFSEGQLSFSGTGSLTVSAVGKNGIASDDYLRFQGGVTVSVTASASADHGLKGKDAVIVNGGTLTVSVAGDGKKCIASDGSVLITDGTLSLTATGGVLYDETDTEDPWKGSAGIKADGCYLQQGGDVTITATGTGGKGVKAGSYDYDATAHTLPYSEISGGRLTIRTSGSESSSAQGSVSTKGIKIGYKHDQSATKAGFGGGGFPGGGGPGGGFPGGQDQGNYSYAGDLIISGGTIDVRCDKAEAIECKGYMTIKGGDIYAWSGADDAINSNGDMVISGGAVYGFSTGNDALDANGDMKISGGVVYAVSTAGGAEIALDANTEGGKALYIYQGATVIACGGFERGVTLEQTCYSMSVQNGTSYALMAGESPICVFKAPRQGTFLVTGPSLGSALADPTVSGGQSCAAGMLTLGASVSGGSSAKLSAYNAASGGFGR